MSTFGISKYQDMIRKTHDCPKNSASRDCIAREDGTDEENSGPAEGWHLNWSYMRVSDVLNVYTGAHGH
jgi:hypothetical protein